MPSAGAQPATLSIAANSNAASASAELSLQFLPRDAPAATCIPAPCQGPASGTGIGGSGRAVVVRVTGLLVAEGTPLDEQLQAGCIFTPISCIRTFVFSYYCSVSPPPHIHVPGYCRNSYAHPALSHSNSLTLAPSSVSSLCRDRAAI
jgi:hypothetical protein